MSASRWRQGVSRNPGGIGDCEQIQNARHIANLIRGNSLPLWNPVGRRHRQELALATGDYTFGKTAFDHMPDR